MKLVGSSFERVGVVGKGGFLTDLDLQGVRYL